MVLGQEASVPPVAGATAVCLEALEDSEGVALKLKAVAAYTAVSNGDPLAVDAELEASAAFGDPSFNGSIIVAVPSLPTVKVIALSDLSEGVTVWVGTPKVADVAVVTVDQWADVRIPGSVVELAAGKTKWSGNGVNLVVSSGMAYSANGNAMLPELGKTAKFELYVDGVTELELVGTVPGQRFYLSVDPENVTADNWLQKRVEAQASTAGAQYVDKGGACYSAATCSSAQVVTCSAGAPKLPCTPGDTLSVWGAPAPMTWYRALLIVK